MTKPRLSVIVPVHQGAKVLPLSLSALLRSDLPREEWELIVVDDASSDATALIAARYADTVVRLPVKPQGPAYARNRGFEASRGEIIVFVDADVCVHPDTLRRFLAIYDADPTIASVFGAYDAAPSHRGVVSTFRNLMHHYVHQRDAGEAETFWAGCGSVRASAFRAVGMFDEWHYARPQIEDIELGRRLRLAGYRIMLRPEIQGTHLKRWTVKDFMSTDLKHRGVPWMLLLLQEGPNAGGRTLNLRASEKFCTALAGLAWLAVAAALVTWSLWPLAYLPVALLLIGIMNRGFYQFVTRDRGIAVALGMLPLHGLFYATNVVSALMGWMLHNLLGEPLAPVVASAEADLDVRTWPPRRLKPSMGVWNGGPPGMHSRKAASRGSREGGGVAQPVVPSQQEVRG